MVKNTFSLHGVDAVSKVVLRKNLSHATLLPFPAPSSGDSAERRESVVRKLLTQPDRPIRELSQETGVSTWTLYNWRRQAMNQGETAVGSTKHAGKWSALTRCA